MIRYQSNDTVTLHGFGTRPLRFPFRVWLRTTDRAVAVVEGAFERGAKTNADATLVERNAKRWLEACWECAIAEAGEPKLSELIAGWKARRNLFDLPADPSRIVRCSRCHVPLTDPVSKLLEMGPVCRDPRKAAVRPERVEVAA